MDNDNILTPEELAKLTGNDSGAPVKPLTPDEYQEMADKAVKEAREALEKLSPEERRQVEIAAKKQMEEQSRSIQKEMERIMKEVLLQLRCASQGRQLLHQLRKKAVESFPGRAI